jgi:hypothetical protein
MSSLMSLNFASPLGFFLSTEPSEPSFTAANGGLTAFDSTEAADIQRSTVLKRNLGKGGKRGGFCFENLKKVGKDRI